MAAGQGRTVPIEAGALASGVYLYRVTAETEGASVTPTPGAWSR